MEKVKAIFISIGSAISSFFGVLFIPIILMVICNTLDFITGIVAAHCKGEQVRSKVFYRGIAKKVGMWCLVLVGVLVDETIRYSVSQFGIALPFTFLIACIVAVWIVCNELLSILENLDEIGVPMPDFLKKLIRYLQHKTEAQVLFPDIEEGEGGEDAEG